MTNSRVKNTYVKPGIIIEGFRVDGASTIQAAMSAITIARATGSKGASHSKRDTDWNELDYAKVTRV